MKLLDPSCIKPRKVHSQGGQDGIIESIFGAIGTTNRFCVEFGFNTDTLTGGSGANTAWLIGDCGWQGLLMDSSFSNQEINLQREFLTPENLEEVFERWEVPRAPDYVSIDVDSVDLWLFKAMLDVGYRPRLVSVEYNANFRIDESATCVLGSRWGGDACYGASLRALHLVGREHAYSLVAVEPGLDAFFLQDELCAPERVPPIDAFAACAGHRMHPVPTIERRRTMVSYPSGEALTTTPWG